MSSKSIKKGNRVKWHKRNKFAGVKLLVDTSIISKPPIKSPLPSIFFRLIFAQKRLCEK